VVAFRMTRAPEMIVTLGRRTQRGHEESFDIQL
jgi:hypothetical protein